MTFASTRRSSASARCSTFFAVEVAALGDKDARVREGLADALEDRDVLGGLAVIVALEREDGVGVRADDRDRLDLRGVEREQAVVL